MNQFVLIGHKAVVPTTPPGEIHVRLVNDGELVEFKRFVDPPPNFPEGVQAGVAHLRIPLETLKKALEMLEGKPIERTAR